VRGGGLGPSGASGGGCSRYRLDNCIIDVIDVSSSYSRPRLVSVSAVDIDGSSERLSKPHELVEVEAVVREIVAYAVEVVLGYRQCLFVICNHIVFTRLRI